MTTPVPIIVDAPKTEPDAGFGALSTPRGNLPLKALDVSARVDGLLARTVVRQRFGNPFGESLEATYIFPLPDRAAVNRFVMRVAGRTIEGELQERGKAREAYEQALKAGRRTAIAEEERPDVFTMRVGNLPPGESIDVELTLTGPLPVDHGEATFRFPLVVAPRYIPGKPLDGESVGDGTHVDTDQVPDASRITPPVLLPGQPSPVQLTLSVEVHPGSLRVSDVHSSLHTVSEGEANGALHFALKPGERLDRDFILRFRIDDAQLSTSLQFQPDAGNPAAGTFALTLVPPRESTANEKPREVVFVLDRSGSMNGWKMIAARRALGRMIDSLTDRDRFAVLAFDNSVEQFPPALEFATDRERFRAVEWLARVESRGGTEMAAPLKQALGLLADAKNDRVLVLVTDGQVGNEDHLLGALAGKLEGVRIFTLGIDQAVNAGFLQRLAGLGGGYCELVESEDRLDAVMAKVHRRIRSPLLSGLSLMPEGWEIEGGTLVPDPPPNLFPGTPLTFLGRFRRRDISAVGLQVKAFDDAGRPRVENVAAAPGEVLAQVWARQHLRVLEDRYAMATMDRPNLAHEIVATSLKFNVLCRFTAFVAVDVQEVVNPGGQVRRVTQPVDAPAGWDMLKREALERVHLDAALCASLSASVRAVPPSAGLARSIDRSLGQFGDEAADAAPPGYIGYASKALRRASTPAAAPVPPANLNAYRYRADELAKRLGLSTDALRELGVVRLKLEELLDDLRSTGASNAELRPLAELLAELRAFLAAPGDVAAMVKRCVEVLSAFAAGTKPKRRGWWK